LVPRRPRAYNSLTLTGAIFAKRGSATESRLRVARSLLLLGLGVA
jgi:hypothetical protein